MRELIFLVVSALNVDENAEIVSSWRHPNTGSCEFCAELIESSSCETFFGTIDEESRDRRVVRSLFGQIRHPYFLAGSA